MSTARPIIDVIYTHFPHYREAVFRALAQDKDFDFRFFYDRDGIEKTIASSDVKLPGGSLETKKLGGVMIQPSVPAHLARTQAKAVILLGNPYIVTNWLGAIIFKLRGRRVMMWTHGWMNRHERGLKALIRNLFYQLADVLLVYGERAKQLGVEQGFAPERIFVIGNSLDYAAQVRARAAAIGAADTVLASHGLESGRYFLTVSRLVAGVGIEQAIEALSALDSKVPFVIVGSGPERDRLERRAADLNVAVVFMGPLYDERDLAPLFLNALAVVSPRKVGLLAMHALAYGAPVITHGDLDRQMPEVEAIENGVTGSFFEYGDISGLAEVMRRYVNGNGTRVSREELVSRAHAMIEARFTPESQVQRIKSAIIQ